MSGETAPEVQSSAKWAAHGHCLATHTDSTRATAASSQGMREHKVANSPVKAKQGQNPTGLEESLKLYFSQCMQRPSRGTEGSNLQDTRLYEVFFSQISN